VEEDSGIPAILSLRSLKIRDSGSNRTRHHKWIFLPWSRTAVDSMKLWPYISYPCLILFYLGLYSGRISSAETCSIFQSDLLHDLWRISRMEPNSALKQ